MQNEDMLILRELRRDSRQTTRQIGKNTDLSAATVHRRLKKLVKDGVIRKFTIEPDWKKIERKAVNFILINVDYHDIKKKNMTQDMIAENLKKHPLVMDAVTVTGKCDIILKVRVRDTQELHDFINWMRKAEGVLQTETLVGLFDAIGSDNVFEEPYF